MARKKVKLVWIQNDSARRATFKKRRKGLMKKVSELSTLCDVKACAIVYNPYESIPEVWPPDNQEVIRVLNRFRSMPEMEQSKKMLNQEGFLRHRIAKLRDQFKKMERDNREAELTSLMYQCIAGRTLHDLGIEAVTNLGWLLEMKLKVVHETIENLRTAGTSMVPVAQNLNGGAPSPLEGLPAADMGNLDSALEVFRRQDMFICSPRFFWPAEEAAMQPYIDGSSHLPTSYPENNQSWLDNYFHTERL